MASLPAQVAHGLAAVGEACRALEALFRAHEEEAAAAFQAKLHAHQASVAESEAELQQQELSLREATAKLDEDRHRFEEEKAAMQRLHRAQQEKVKLDIGGHKYSTARSTLTSIPGTLFDTILSGQSEFDADEDDGSFFLDRDGRLFHHFLAFLRDPATFEPPADIAVCKELLREAEFYKIPIAPRLESVLNPPQPVIKLPTPLSTPRPGRSSLPSINALREEDPHFEQASMAAYQGSDVASVIDYSTLGVDDTMSIARQDGEMSPEVLAVPAEAHVMFARDHYGTASIDGTSISHDSRAPRAPGSPLAPDTRRHQSPRLAAIPQASNLASALFGGPQSSSARASPAPHASSALARSASPAPTAHASQLFAAAPQQPHPQQPQQHSQPPPSHQSQPSPQPTQLSPQPGSQALHAPPHAAHSHATSLFPAGPSVVPESVFGVPAEVTLYSGAHTRTHGHSPAAVPMYSAPVGVMHPSNGPSTHTSTSDLQHPPSHAAPAFSHAAPPSHAPPPASHAAPAAAPQPAAPVQPVPMQPAPQQHASYPPPVAPQATQQPLPPPPTTHQPPPTTAPPPSIPMYGAPPTGPAQGPPAGPPTGPHYGQYGAPAIFTPQAPAEEVASAPAPPPSGGFVSGKHPSLSRGGRAHVAFPSFFQPAVPASEFPAPGQSMYPPSAPPSQPYQPQQHQQYQAQPPANPSQSSYGAPPATSGPSSVALSFDSGMGSSYSTQTPQYAPPAPQGPPQTAPPAQYGAPPTQTAPHTQYGAPPVHTAPHTQYGAPPTQTAPPSQYGPPVVQQAPPPTGPSYSQGSYGQQYPGYQAPSQPPQPTQPPQPSYTGASTADRRRMSAALDQPDGASNGPVLRMDPIKQSDRDQLRGWNDPPAGLSTKRARMPVVHEAIPAVAPITAPVVSVAPVEPAAPAPAQEAPTPAAPAELPPAVASLKAAFDSILAGARASSNVGNTRKLDEIARKLDTFYQRSSQLPEMIPSLQSIAGLLVGGNAGAALQTYNQLAAAASFDESGSYLPAVKTLIQLASKGSH
eukprot:m.81576 g.81576  ORF g.81576 m.81576 type:complete len:1034 (+) comp8083_c0_seq2:25-3126(+)